MNAQTPRFPEPPPLCPHHGNDNAIDPGPPPAYFQWVGLGAGVTRGGRAMGAGKCRREQITGGLHPESGAQNNARKTWEALPPIAPAKQSHGCCHPEQGVLCHPRGSEWAASSQARPGPPSDFLAPRSSLGGWHSWVPAGDGNGTESKEERREHIGQAAARPAERMLESAVPPWGEGAQHVLLWASVSPLVK